MTQTNSTNNVKDPLLRSQGSMPVFTPSEDINTSLKGRPPSNIHKNKKKRINLFVFISKVWLKKFSVANASKFF